MPLQAGQILIEDHLFIYKGHNVSVVLLTDHLGQYCHKQADELVGTTKIGCESYHMSKSHDHSVETKWRLCNWNLHNGLCFSI